MLRPYEKKDKPACVHLFLEIFCNPPYDYHWMTQDNTLRYFTDLENTPCFLGVTFWEDKTLAGFCLGVTSDYFIGKSYEIKEIAVAKSLQGEGRGGKLLALLTEFLKQQQVDVMTLATHQSLNAYSFYQKQGFEVSEGAVYMHKAIG